MSEITPVICCIGYNRPASMQRLLNSIGNAYYCTNNITLIISIDQSSMSEAVLKVAENFDWKYGEKKIILHEKRLGLREHCLLCGDFATQYGAVIFLEDDVVVAPGYYRFMCQAVNFYADYGNIIGISLYCDHWVPDLNTYFEPLYNGYDTFFVQRELSHGQCWTRNGWLKFREWYNQHSEDANLYNKNVPPCVYNWNPKTSWSRFMSFFMAEEKMYYACPYHAYATNMSEVGTHAVLTTDVCQTVLCSDISGEYRFCTPKSAISYDAFFEMEKIPLSSIKGVPIEKICIDLNGHKYDYDGYSHLLTTNILPFKQVGQYGINMEPIENNIIYEVPGNSIFLYEIPENCKYTKQLTLQALLYSKDRFGHYLNKIPTDILFHNIYSRFLQKIKNRLRRLRIW